MADVRDASRQVSGELAHAATDAGKPVKIGCKSAVTVNTLTEVTAGQITDAYAGTDGILIVRNNCALGDVVSGTQSTTGTASVQVIAAAGANIYQHLTGCTVFNTSATPTFVRIKSGSTDKWLAPLPANGGCALSWDPPLPPNAANESWNFAVEASVTTAYCSMVGFKSKLA